ncbi:MAG: TatD family hydrolase [Candidatus Omnitrophota bacterium]|nr:TatD family hydrolase [Candidatus Omnitrophota bacterium]
MFNLIDTHCHLDQIEDIDTALKEAKAEGLKAIITVGTNYQSNLRNLEIAKNLQIIKVFVALGIHPTEILLPEIESCLKFIRENIGNAVAIGEIGLDYWYKNNKKDQIARELQREVFLSQLNLAKEFNLPVIIHSRGAWQDCWDIIISCEIKKAVFHWFSGPLNILKEIIKAGFLISATPALGYSPQHQEAIKNSPIENIIIETDSPVFYRNKNGGFKASPKDVVRTLELLAQIKQMPISEMQTITTENAVNFFNLK